MTRWSITLSGDKIEENKMPEQNKPGEVNPSQGSKQGGGDSPATQPSRGDKDSHPTGQGGDRGGNTPSTPSQGSGGSGRNQ
jgi:hypothetical protein